MFLDGTRLSLTCTETPCSYIVHWQIKSWGNMFKKLTLQLILEFIGLVTSRLGVDILLLWWRLSDVLRVCSSYSSLQSECYIAIVPHHNVTETPLSRRRLIWIGKGRKYNTTIASTRYCLLLNAKLLMALACKIYYTWCNVLLMVAFTKSVMRCVIMKHAAIGVLHV